MTATPPRADLRTLAAEALDSLPDCPPDHWGGRDILDPCVDCQANAVLAAVLPEHRRMVLTEAADAAERALKAKSDELADGKRSSIHPTRHIDEGIGAAKAIGPVRQAILAAAAPPAGLSAPVPAENAPAVPEEAAGRCVCHPDIVWGWYPTSMGGGHRAIRGVSSGGLFRQRDDGVEEFDSVAGFRTTHPEEADGQRATEGDALDPFRPCPIRCGWTQDWTEFDDEVGLRAARGQHLDRHSTYEIVVALDLVRDERNKAATDRDRLAAQVGHYQRVVEAAKAWRNTSLSAWQVADLDERALIRAVDALPDAGTDQTEGGHG